MGRLKKIKKEEKKEKNLESVLEDIYYNPKTGYGGVQSLYRQLRAKGYSVSLSEIRKWLKEQEAYTLHKPIKRKFIREQTRVTGIDEQWQLELEGISF